MMYALYYTQMGQLINFETLELFSSVLNANMECVLRFSVVVSLKFYKMLKSINRIQERSCRHK
jgi:hypothetical protein